MNKKETFPVLELINDLYRIFESTGTHPATGSPADHEIQTYQRSESVLTAFGQAAIVLEAAADHLEALNNLVQTEEYAVAPWTCARGVLEASTIAIWLLDTNIDAKERVSRSLSLRFATLCAQERMANSVGDKASVGIINDRIQQVEDVAVNLGFSLMRDKKGKRTGIAQSRPKITELIESQLNKHILYRVLSGFAHSDYAILLHLAASKIDTVHSRGSIMKRTIHKDKQATLLANTAAVYARGAWLRTVQYGCDPVQAAVVLEKRYNELELPNTNEVRFWRTDIISSH